MTEPDARTIFKSAVWNHAGKLVEYAVLYLTSIVIARSLGVQENGTFVGLTSIAQLLFVLSSFGLEASLNKHIPQLAPAGREEQTRFLLRRVLGLRLVVFALVGAVWATVVRFFQQPLIPGIHEYLLILIVYAGLRSVTPLMAMVLTAQLRTALASKISLVARCVELVGIVALSRFGLTINHVFFLLVAGAFLQLVLYATFSRRNLFGPEGSAEVSPVLVFGGIYWLNTVGEFFLGRQGDLLLISSLIRDPSQSSLYDVAYGIAQLATLGTTLGLGGVTFATFARLTAFSSEKANLFYPFLVRLVSLLTIPIFAFLLFNQGALVTGLYSSQYAGAALLVQGIVAFRIVGRAFAGAENAEYLLSQNRVGTVVAIGLIGAALNVLLDILLIPRFGAVGAVVASGNANVLVNILGALGVRRRSGAKLQILYWSAVAGSSVFSSYVAHVLVGGETIMVLLSRFVIFAVLFIFCLYLLKPIRPSDLLWFSRIHKGFATWLKLFTRGDSPTQKDEVP